MIIRSIYPKDKIEALISNEPSDSCVFVSDNNVSIASFPYTISKSGIEDQTSGTVEISWLDATQNTISTQSQNVSFTEQ